MPPPAPPQSAKSGSKSKQPAQAPPWTLYGGGSADGDDQGASDGAQTPPWELYGGGKSASAAPTPPAPPEYKPSWLERAWNTIPGIGTLHEMSGEAQAAAERAAKRSEMQPEHPIRAGIETGLAGAGADVAGLVHGLTGPSGVAQAAATAIAPEVMLPYFTYKGSEAALTPRREGETRADALQRRLMGGATVAGAVAGTKADEPIREFKQGIREGRDVALTPKRLESGQRGLLEFLRETPGKGGKDAEAMANDVKLATESGALPYIFREAPLEGKGAQVANQFIDRIDQYQQDLWEESHKAPVEREAGVDLKAAWVRQRVRNAFDPDELEAYRRMEGVNGAEHIRRAFDDIDAMLQDGLTVRQGDKLIRTLNGEIRNPPAAWGPIDVRMRMEALRQLRLRLNDALVEEGETEILPTNQLWGALDNIKHRMAERYPQEWLKEAGKSPVPDWMHAYAFANAHRLAMGFGFRLAKMLLPNSDKMLLNATRDMARAHVAPPEPALPTPRDTGFPYARPQGPSSVISPPGRALPPVGGTTEGRGIRMGGRGLTEIGEVPRAPRTSMPAPPIVTPAPEANLARIPGRAYERFRLGEQAPGGPRTMPPPPEMPPSEGAAPLARIPGRAYQEAASAGVRTPPPGYSSPASMSPIPEVEAHMAGLLRAGKISRGEIMRMTRLGVLGQGAATRIFKLAGK